MRQKNGVNCVKKAIGIHLGEKVAENAANVGKHILERLSAEFRSLPCVGDVDGFGLMIGIEIAADKATKKTFEGNVIQQIQDRAMEEGVILHGTSITFFASDRVSFAPPLRITIQEADRALDMLKPMIASLRPAEQCVTSD